MGQYYSSRFELFLVYSLSTVNICSLWPRFLGFTFGSWRHLFIPSRILFFMFSLHSFQLTPPAGRECRMTLIVCGLLQQCLCSVQLCVCMHTRTSMLTNVTLTWMLEWSTPSKCIIRNVCPRLIEDNALAFSRLLWIAGYWQHIYISVGIYNVIHLKLVGQWERMIVLVSSAQSLEVDQPFVESREVITEYCWLLYWICVDLSYQTGFVQSYVKVCQKMACERPLFWALMLYVPV